MRRLLPLLALVPAVASAGKLDRFLEGADAVEIPGPVEVPLLAWENSPAIELKATVGEGEDATERSFVALVDLALLPNFMTTDLAEALGAKVKSFKAHGMKVEWATVPELRIGAVVLHDVTALVDGDTGLDLRDAQMILGASTLEELATAIVPSRGVVKFVPAADGAALLGEVGTALDAQLVEQGSFYHHGQKGSMSGVPMLSVVGRLGGREGRIVPSTAGPRTLAKPFDEGMTRTEFRLDTPTLGDVTLPEVIVWRDFGLTTDPNDAIIGWVGWDALHATDIAVWPAGQKLALKTATASKHTSAQLVLLDQARKDYAEATKPPEGDAAEGDEESKDDETVGIGDKGDKKKVSAELDLAGPLGAARYLVESAKKEELEHLAAAAAAAGDSCKAHRAYGRALLELSGDPAAAAVELKLAAEGYDRWMAQDRLVRAQIADGKNKSPDAYIVEQSTGCHRAWGDLAGAYLALGDHEQVEAIYRAHTDLDSDLPFAYGLSLLAQGKNADAVGPFRQALELDGRLSSGIRGGLAMSGDSQSFTDVGLQRLADAGVADHLGSLAPIIEAARTQGGNGLARRVAEGISTNAPHAIPGRLLLARELPASERGPALDAAKRLIDTQRALSSGTVSLTAWDGLRVAILNGDKAVASVSAAHTGDPEAEMAALLALHDAGDVAGARSHRNTLVKHTPLTLVSGLPDAWFSARMTSGLPGTPKPPVEAPAPVYTASCAEIPAASYDTPIVGTWVASGDTRDRIAFQTDRWCVFDDAGVRAQGGPASWSIYACPGESPAADKPVQETYLLLRDAAHGGLTTCNRFVQYGDNAGLYGQACPGEAPFNTYGASGRIGQWSRTQEAAPAACWTDPAPVVNPPKGK